MPSPDRLTNYADKHPDFLRAIQASLGTVGRSAAERLADAERNGGDGYGSGFEAIINLETRASLEEAYELTTRIAQEYLGIDAPTPEDMTARGVDHVYLASEIERMEREGLMPHVVLAPHGLGLGEADSGHGWRQAYAKATADTTIPNNPLREDDNGAGLFWFYGDAVPNWDSFDKAPTTTTTPGASILPTHETTTPDGKIIQWTLRVIPGTPKSQNLGQDYNGIANGPDGKPLPAPSTPPTHQTIAEMLADKLTSIMAREEPSDTEVAGTYYSSWCDNGYRTGNSAGALDGRWNSGKGQVDVYWNVVDGHFDERGSRSPVG